MTPQDFKNLYDLHSARLSMELEDLKSRLHDGIERIQRERSAKGLPASMFRIRLKEARVKDWQSLYEKVVQDQELSAEDAFRPGHVRDLLGARIVCHNLTDLKSIVDSLMKGQWGPMHYVLPAKGEKRWLDEPQPHSGYRGWHVDVRWSRRTGKEDDFSFAELQVRTLLQDSWATYMHDDVYKARASLLLPDSAFAQFRDLSNILFALDQMADRVRTDLERARVSDGLQVSALESMSRAMYSMLAHARAAGVLPSYDQISRVDRYVIRGTDSEFTFEIDGRLGVEAPFVFLIAGDSSGRAAERIWVERFNGRSNHWERLEGTAFTTRVDDPIPNTLIVSVKQRGKRHRFRVGCTWRNAFPKGGEYIWCPWGWTYGDALRSYTLQVEHPATQLMSPRLLRIREYGSLNSLMEAYRSGKGEAPSTKTAVDVIHEFRVEDLSADILCPLTPALPT